MSCFHKCNDGERKFGTKSGKGENWCHKDRLKSYYKVQDDLKCNIVKIICCIVIQPNTSNLYITDDNKK